MIRLENVSKHYETMRGDKTVLHEVNLQIAPGEKVGILGRNGAGKSTLIRIMGGVTLPDSGTITQEMSLSWPLGFDSGVQGTMTGMDNINFICRIYGVDVDEVLPFVENFSELGRYIHEPVRSYSSGMKARLNFAISMAIDFDCMLIDEVLAVGDQRFKERCHEELLVKRKERAIVLVSHEPGMIREICDSAYVLVEGHLHHFNEVAEAYLFYTETMQ
jgi:capsular polysaccharide transport system ATP-binding protein